MGDGKLQHTGIKVHGHVGKIQLSDGVVGALEVSILGIGTLLNVQVGHQVGQAVRLYTTISNGAHILFYKVNQPMTRRMFVSEYVTICSRMESM